MPLQPENNSAKTVIAEPQIKTCLLILLKFILDRVRLFAFIAGKKPMERHSASRRYTLCASGRKNQMSQAQFRAKSGVRAVVNGWKDEEESSRAGLAGNAQATVAGARGEN
jgi:hypothetical protein